MPLPLTVSGSVLRCTQGKVTDGHTNLFCCGYTVLPNGRYQVFQRLPWAPTAALPQVNSAMQSTYSRLHRCIKRCMKVNSSAARRWSALAPQAV
jgi:hypothetical protein